MMEYCFSVSDATLSDSFHRMLELFSEAVVPQLFYFEEYSTLKARIPATSLKYNSEVLLAGDATLFPSKNPENLLLSQLMYSTYKNHTGFQAVIGSHVRLF